MPEIYKQRCAGNKRQEFGTQGHVLVTACWNLPAACLLDPAMDLALRRWNSLPLLAFQLYQLKDYCTAQGKRDRRCDTVNTLASVSWNALPWKSLSCRSLAVEFQTLATKATEISTQRCGTGMTLVFHHRNVLYKRILELLKSACCLDPTI